MERERRRYVLLGARLLAALLALGLVGRALEGRVAWLGFLSYVPVLGLVVPVLVADLVLGGRTIPRLPRGSLSIAAAAAAGVIAIQMIGWSAPAAAPGRPIRVLQWNVLWGGGLDAKAPRWGEMVEEVAREKPDVAIINESPYREDGFEMMRRALGEDWSVETLLSAPDEDWWYRVAIYAPGPIEVRARKQIDGAVAFLADVDVRGRPLRILAVDGRSTPFRDRAAMIRDVARIMREAAGTGRPVDLVAGDFNAQSLNAAFAELARTGDGYVLASEYARGWRGTYPKLFPIFDLDHVWVRVGIAILGWSRMESRLSDHFGQVVTIALPD